MGLIYIKEEMDFKRAASDDAYVLQIKNGLEEQARAIGMKIRAWEATGDFVRKDKSAHYLQPIMFMIAELEPIR